MTVKELIDHLSQYPPETPVIYKCFSDYEVLEAEGITFTTERVVYRGGRYCMAYPAIQYPAGEQPNPVPVVCFPGN